jgi:hypothetical protein
MFKNQTNIQLYGGHFIDDVFPSIKNRISDEISALSENQINEIDVDEFSEKLFLKYSLDFPLVKLEDVFVTTVEKNIPAERFPASFTVFSGKSYKKDVIIYHIPFDGDIDILSFKPNPFSTFGGYPFLIDRSRKCFLLEIINFSNDAEQIKREYDDSVKYITRDYVVLQKNCEAFNSNLKSSIVHIINSKKEQQINKNNFLTTLGIPVKKEEKKDIPIPVENKENKKVKTQINYDLAISFAGEDRQIAEDIANELKLLGYEIFYDKYEQANLWGKNLYEHLSEIYSKKARFCLMIISDSYAKKHWTNHEREAAQAKAFKQNEEYILPLRLDETEIPGLHATVGYINYKTTGLKDTINLLKEKLS